MSIWGKYDLYETEVIKLEKITTGVFVLSFKKQYNFIAGQVVAVSAGPEYEPRLYSIASGENDENMKILFNVVPEGKLTMRMSGLAKGAKIFVSKPFGKFTGTKDHAYWIATGTGIAPFLSMLYSGQSDKKIIIHGGRTLNSFYFRDVFETHSKQNYIACCSQENARGVFYGRVTDYLKQQNELPANYKYYLCGSAEMVVETRDLLIQKGIPFSQIIAEIYF